VMMVINRIEVDDEGRSMYEERCLKYVCEECGVRRR